MTGETLQPPINPESLAEVAQELFNVGYKETDAQFNLLPAVGDSRVGYDVVHPESKTRILITQAGSADSEAIVTGVLGEHAIFSVQERNTDEGYATYEIPRGARLLEKTLKSGPYARPYMQSLTIRAATMLDNLRAMDDESFGIDISKLASSHNGDDDGKDDAFLTVIPPLAPPTDPSFYKLGAERYAKRMQNKLRLARTLGEAALSNSDIERYAREIMAQPGIKKVLSDDLIQRYFSDEAEE